MATKVLALGDSWFHYPYGLDKDGNILGAWYKIRRLLKLVGDRGNGNIIKFLVQENKLPLSLKETSIDQLWDAVRSPVNSEDDVLGQCGEELLVMVTGCKRSKPGVKVKGHDTTWLDTLESRVRNYASANNRFVILLSGGGNDIADENLLDFLNDVSDPAGPVKTAEFTKAITQLQQAYQTIFTQLSTKFPDKEFNFFLHGYGYPPVNGRGVFMFLEKSPLKFLQSLSPGPWLKPFFDKKKITDRMLQEKIIGDFIDKFNDMLKALTAPTAKVVLHYVDLRPITNKVDRDPGWCNELHFDHDAYVKSASTTYQIIQPLL